MPLTHGESTRRQPCVMLIKRVLFSVMSNALPFLEAIQVERGYGTIPAGHDSPSARMRRLLLHGGTLTPTEASERAGGSKALLLAVMAIMKEWGFKFEAVDTPTGRGHRLVNPDHVPTTRVKRVPKPRARPRAAKSDTKATASGGLLDDITTRPGSKISQLVARLATGEPVTTKQVAEEMGMDGANLRKAIRMIELAGWEVEKSGHPLAYSVVGRSKDGGGKKGGAGLAKRATSSPVPNVNRSHDDRYEFAPPPMALPQLDQELEVYLVFRDPATRAVKVGVRNGSVSWLCTVDAHVSAEEFSAFAGH
jgi:biotin operon repressor